MGLLGIIARERREFDKAMEYFERGVVLMRQVGAKTGEANALHNIGVVYGERGENDEALAYIEEALVLLKAHGDVRSRAMVMHDLAYVHFNAFSDAECLSFMEDTLSAYRESGDWRGEMLSMADFGYMLYAMGEFERARAMVGEAVQRSTAHMRLPDEESVLATMAEVQDSIGQIAILVSMAFNAEYDGRFTEAIRYAERCLDLVRRLWKPWGETRLLGQLSSLHGKLGDTATAVRYAEEAVRAAEQSRQPRALVIAKETLARATARSSVAVEP